MFFATDLNVITSGIQLSVAPVFLLTAVSGMVGAAASRLTRIIDRARYLEELIGEKGNANTLEKFYEELARLKTRGRLVNVCIALLILCAILIGLTIVVLFLGETTEIRTSRFAPVTFLTGVCTFVMALLCFLAETILATRIFKFAKPHK